MLVTLNEVLYDAKKNHYAVGLFNTVNQEMLRAVIAAAEEENSPVIVGTAEILLPNGPLELISAPILDMAKKAKVPVVVHFDHGLTFDATLKALHLGFSSVMFDASSYSYEENIAQTCEMAKIAHSLGASIEAELGHVGSAGEQEADTNIYTDPQQALEFAKATGVDALAVSIGTAHGQYKVKPKLNIDILSQIRQKVDIPLVLHGGSGLSDDDFRNCIRNGIAKVNIFTDLTLAAYESIKTDVADGTPYLELLNHSICSIKNEVVKKMRLFGSNGKA